ncbi:MAG: ATP-binding protein, partial [Thermomicrobiales bacterium]
RAQVLVEIADLLAAAPKPEAVLDQALDAAAAVLGDLNAVLLADPDRHELTLAAIRTTAPDTFYLARELFTTREPPGLLAVVAPAAGRDDILVTRPHDDTLPPRFRRDAARIGLRSLLAVPMVEHGHVVGVYVSGRTGADRSPVTASLGAEDLSLAREFAARLAGALVGARLHAETRQALNESEALRRIGQELSTSIDVDQVFELVSSFARLLLNSDFAAVAAEGPDGGLAWRAMVGNRTDAHGDELVRHSYGVVGRAAAARRTVVIQGFPDNPDFPPAEFPVLQAEETRSALAVPLRAGERIFGALVVGYRRPCVFAPGELRLAEALATQAAIALEHARLFAEAQRAIAQRDQFLSVAAHELRTPLTTLRGRVQLLRRRMLDTLPPATDEALQVILRQVDRLSRMVNDLLDVSRVQTGRLPLVRERVDLVDLLRRGAHDAAGDEGPTITFECDLPSLVARVDPWRIEQVMANLLGNARRFSPPTGQIVVRIAREGDSARIEVEDEGIGIASEHIERIFEPFYQVDPEPRTGVGLGLAICRQIVGDHGGRLWATSHPSGPGSTFVMTLPLGDE